MFSIKVSKKDMNGTIQRLHKLIDEYRKPIALYTQWGKLSKKWVTDNFNLEGGLLAEGKWAKLSPITIKKRLAKSRRKIVILKDTGELKKSFTTRQLSGNRGIAIGTKLRRGKDHNVGSKRRRLPKRRILPTQKDKSFMERLSKATMKYIQKIVAAAGRG